MVLTHDYVLQAVLATDPRACQLHLANRRGRLIQAVRGSLSRSQRQAYREAAGLIARDAVGDWGRAVRLLQAVGFDVTIVT